MASIGRLNLFLLISFRGSYYRYFLIVTIFVNGQFTLKCRMFIAHRKVPEKLNRRPYDRSPASFDHLKINYIIEAAR